MAQLNNTQEAGFTEANLNPLGSFFGLNPGVKDRSYIQREVWNILTRTWPQMYIDMTLLGRKTPEFVDSDEFEYFQNTYDRVGMTVSAATAASFSPVVVTVATTDNSFLNMLVATGGGTTALVIAINPNNNTITLRPGQGKQIPALAVGQILSFVSPIEGDGAKTINFKYRMEPQRLYNYVYLVSGMVEYTMLELQKQKAKNYLTNFMNEEFENLVLHIRNSMSNMFWQGQRGLIELNDGRKAKMCEGIDEFIVNGGVTITTPLSSFGDAVEQAGLATQYGMTGQTKFLFCTPRRLSQLQKQFKNLQTNRYMLSDSTANLKLTEYDFGSFKAVTVPMLRFQDTASFPVEYQNYAYLIDFDNIKPVKLRNWADTGQTPSRKDGSPFLNMSVQRYIADSMSTRNFNAPSHAKIIIQ